MIYYYYYYYYYYIMYSTSRATTTKVAMAVRRPGRITHSHKISCGKVVGLVLKVERVEPLKQRVVEAKLQLGVVLDRICQLTWKLEVNNYR